MKIIKQFKFLNKKKTYQQEHYCDVTIDLQGNSRWACVCGRVRRSKLYAPKRYWHSTTTDDADGGLEARFYK